MVWEAIQLFCVLCSLSPTSQSVAGWSTIERWIYQGGFLVLGLASGLEAFSREPPCDSVGALAVRQTPETSGMAWEFLSYYPILPSRNLRDPFCTLVRLFSLVMDDSRQATDAVGAPRTSPISLCANFSRNFRLSRVKPTCLTTV